MASLSHTIRSQEITHLLRQVVPKIEYHLHKGQMGRIGIIGGSIDYTGAPYYAAQSSLYFGADLATIFCSTEALIPIKSYSPELMVTPLYDSAEIDAMDDHTIATQLINKLTPYLPRLHALVVGPGLGRHPKLLPNLVPSIRLATETHLPLVFDADGLFLVSQDLNLVRGNHRCVLTPNVNEFRMLVNRAIFEINSSLTADSLKPRPMLASHLLDTLTSGTLPQQLHSLCAVLGGVTVLLKGEDDMICGSVASRPTTLQPAEGLPLSMEGISDVFIIQASEKGAPRRCGGQGDILSGCMATSLYWSLALQSTTSSSPLTSLQPIQEILEERQDGEGSRFLPEQALQSSPTLLGCILASSVVRAASSAAFLRKGRAMTSPDILQEIGAAFQRTTES